MVDVQRKDSTLSCLFDTMLSPDEVQRSASWYFVQDGTLLRKWMSQSKNSGGESLEQIVVPTKLRDEVLKVVHGPITWHLNLRQRTS